MQKKNEFQNIIDRFSDKNISDDEIIELILRMARSGDILEFPSPAFDFASTGGPSSLTTLLVPLYLYGFGVGVINLAVPGRPAGAVDVLSQIKGYDLNGLYQSSKLEPPFYIHLIANERFAPMDRTLFEYRKKVNKVNIPNLAISSLLSKKVASGATHIGLDVRVSSFGNFGVTWNDCVDNSRKFNRIAQKLGLHSVCFLSDGDSPYQKYIGRGESLLALYDIFTGSEDELLQEHKEYSKQIAYCMIESSDIPLNTIDVDIRKCFEENLIFQGSTYKEFLKSVNYIKMQPHVIISANSEGYVKYDLCRIREYIVYHQTKYSETQKFPDTCGITLLADPGTFVEMGTPILSIRQLDIINESELNGLFSIHNEKIYIEKRKEVIQNG